jgi:hypothetical protein
VVDSARSVMSLLKCWADATHSPVATLEKHDVLPPFSRVWIAMALTDHSCFNLLLGCAARLQDQTLQQPCLPEGEGFAGNSESARYYSKLMTQLTRRLEHDVESLSDGVIVTIVGLACHAVSSRHICN